LTFFCGRNFWRHFVYLFLTAALSDAYRTGTQKSKKLSEWTDAVMATMVRSG
jgi:hypothetical protein